MTTRNHRNRQVCALLIALSTALPTVNGDEYDALIEQGRALHQERKFDEAIGVFTEAIELRPNIGEVYQLRADSEGQKLGKSDGQKRMSDYSKAIELDPNNFRSYHQRGQLFERHEAFQNTEKALADYSAAIKIDPNSINALVLRGALRITTGKHEAGWKDLDATLKCDVSRDDRGIEVFIMLVHAEMAAREGGEAAAQSDERLININTGTKESMNRWIAAHALGTTAMRNAVIAHPDPQERIGRHFRSLTRLLEHLVGAGIHSGGRQAIRVINLRGDQGQEELKNLAIHRRRNLLFSSALDIAFQSFASDQAKEGEGLMNFLMILGEQMGDESVKATAQWLRGQLSNEEDNQWSLKLHRETKRRLVSAKIQGALKTNAMAMRQWQLVGDIPIADVTNEVTRASVFAELAAQNAELEAAMQQWNWAVIQLGAAEQLGQLLLPEDRALRAEQKKASKAIFAKFSK